MVVRRLQRGSGIIASLWLLALLCVASVAIAAPESIQLHYQVINNFPVKFVTVNLNDPDIVVTPVTAPRFPTGLERWSSFLNRLQPDAAINGTYFCPQSCMPVGDVAINGSLLFKGVAGTALCLTPDNQVCMLPGPRQLKTDWRGFRSVLCAGPRLLTNGMLAVDPRAEGFRDPRVLGSAPRSAVALRADNLLVLLTIEKNISLTNLAYVCQRLGAVQAMALDGGSSSGLAAWGRTVTAPSRSLSTFLAVYSTRQRYFRVANNLFPPSARVLANLQITGPITITSLPGEPQPVAPVVTVAAPKTPQGPLIRLLRPAGDETVRGGVTVSIDVAAHANVSWLSLRINGRLRAMTNTWPLEYQWDSTHDEDGLTTLEVCAWSADRSLLARDARQVQVQNNAVTAKQ